MESSSWNRKQNLTKTNLKFCKKNLCYDFHRLIIKPSNLIPFAWDFIQIGIEKKKYLIQLPKWITIKFSTSMKFSYKW